MPKLLLLFVIIFNLIFLFPETKILSDLNDNVFAFALIEKANQAWEESLRSCPQNLSLVACRLSLVADHWVSTWAMGYPLPHFYQHLPHLTIVFLYHFLSLFKSINNQQPTINNLFNIFNFFKYLMLSLLPLSFYWAAKKFRFSHLTASLTALISTMIATNYLYGWDYNSLVWRGSGMYTQLWGMFFAPLALASLFETFVYRQGALRSIILLTLTFHSHLLFGYLVALSSCLLPVCWLILEFLRSSGSLGNLGKIIKALWRQSRSLLLVFASSFFLLSSWLIPLSIDNPYHNKSPWDSLWKFDSFGYLKVFKMLFNGELFDYGRLPVLTFLLFVGLIFSFQKIVNFLPSKDQKSKSINYQLSTINYLYLVLLFFFWLALFFGRTTWAGLIDLLPMVKETHLHRFINGVHLPSIFLIGIGLTYSLSFLKSSFAYLLKKQLTIFSFCFLLFAFCFLLFPVFRERYQYLTHNTTLIRDHNQKYQNDIQSFQPLLNELEKRQKENPGRAYAGRPGNWGNGFTVGYSPVYMILSVNNFDTLGFEPESWSPNTDIEQFFKEDRQDHYHLFNIKYVISPQEIKFPDFVKLVQSFGPYFLYQVETPGDFQLISSPFTVLADKRNKINFDRLWLESQWPSLNAHPRIVYKESPSPDSLISKSLKLSSWSSYQVDGQEFSLLADNPFFATPSAQLTGKITRQERTFGQFSSQVEVPTASLLMLKATYLPGWQVKIDGQDAKKIMVSPAFVATPLSPGTHWVEFSYQPPRYKIWLLIISLLLTIKASP